MVANTEKKLGTGAGIAWNSVGNFVYLFAQWLLTYVVVKTLGYESAGLFSLCLTIANQFFGIATYAMRGYQSSDVEGEYSHLTYVRSRYTTCAAFIVIAVLFTISKQYEFHVTCCVIVYVLFKATEALSDVYQGILQLGDRLDYVGISFLIRGGAEFVVFLCAVLLAHNLLLALILLAATSTAIVLFYDRKAASSLVSWGSSQSEDVRRLLITCFPIALYGVFLGATGQVPRLAIEELLGAESLGYYTTVAMPVVVIQVAASFIFSPLVTPMARFLKEGDAEGFRKLVVLTLGVLLAIAGISFVGFYLFGNQVLILVFGESIAPYCYLKTPLLLCTVLTALSWFLASIITVLRKLASLCVASLVSLVIVLVGSVPFVEQFGLNGASYILAVALSVFIVCCVGVTVASIKKAGRSSLNSVK